MTGFWEKYTMPGESNPDRSLKGEQGPSHLRAVSIGCNYIFDSLLGGEVEDWSGQALGQKKEATVASESGTNSEATSNAKEPVVPLSVSWMGLTGTYVHAGYGEMMVELTDGELRAGFNSMIEFVRIESRSE